MCTRTIGKTIYFYKTVGSTQALALSLAEKKAATSTGLHGTVIIAQRQRKGTGKAGRRWISPAGGIWMSIILTPRISASQSIIIMFLATLAVYEVIKSKTGLNAKIKWPNDITINGSKVCGTIVDISTLNEDICYAVIGIGINVNNTVTRVISELRGKEDRFYGITSLKKELGGADVSLVDFLKSLLERLEYYYDQLQQGFAYDILDKWKNNMAIDQPIQIRERDKFVEAISKTWAS